ncbi:GntR family transcriptional regulator [Peribacillus cavernae]|uniref:GntR family transcriptional regulator n=1 Tax=Peribacillus cavernae TaxID=1674310 RepID=A0A433HFG0_9BACI|nr:GntR family transcriptional regulator [Peribacillus cavernae]MDQ0219519.1 DNA-binding GntR family transcriptional regulator [Peribacillus cavernae]RUQ27067.1 GntR family transcriptional regulator [Peribacillus cavernae]
MKKNLNLKLEDRDTLHLKVTNVIRQEILNGNIEPGERLVQEDLAHSLGVSRMPIREALRLLEAEGLIQLEPHKGAIVKSMEVEDVEEIYELRSRLEGLAVSKSADKLSGEAIVELEKLTIQMKNSEEVEDFVKANIEFHSILMKHCTWKRLTAMIEKLWNGFPQHTPTMLSGQIDKSNKEHEEILEAVKRKDAEHAGVLISNHIKRTGVLLVKNMQDNRNKR